MTETQTMCQMCAEGGRNTPVVWYRTALNLGIRVMAYFCPFCDRERKR